MEEENNDDNGVEVGDSPSKRATLLNTDNSTHIRELEKEFKLDTPNTDSESANTTPREKPSKKKNKVDKDKIKQKKIDFQRSIAERAQKRIQYLLQQSDAFNNIIDKSKQNLPQDLPKKRRQSKAERDEDDNLLRDGLDKDMNNSISVLTVQPTCIEGKMRNYQLDGLNWLLSLYENYMNGILADEMGLGKTLQTISLLGYLKQMKLLIGPHLIIVPKSTLGNWINEIKRWCPLLKPLKFHGDAEERENIKKEHLSNPNNRMWDICLTTFEMAYKEKTLLTKFNWGYVIIDEAHRIKNEHSQLSEAVRCFDSEYRLLLTGTPLQNNLHELWSLLNFLLPEVFTSSSDFDKTFDLVDTDDIKVKENIINQLHKILKPFMLRRLKSDVEKSLPPKEEVHIYVGMSDMQRELYRSILTKNIDVLRSITKEKGHLLNMLVQLRKVCNHPYLFEGVEDMSLDPMGEHLIMNCGKLILLDKLLPKLKCQGSRVLLFCQMTRVLDILEDYCFIRKYNYCRLDGQTSGDDRDDMIDRFNEDGSDIFIFLLSTRAGGLGINLATADSVIFYDSDWNPKMDLQAQDRAHRIGQKKPVKIYRLITEDSVEKRIVERAEMKMRLDTFVIQQGRLTDANKTLSAAEMANMIMSDAKSIFHSDSKTISDEDIDTILEKGKQKTKEMIEEVEKQVPDVAKLLDFKIGDTNLRVFEGVNYKDVKEKQKEVVEEVEQYIIQDSAFNKRERKQVKYFNEQPIKEAPKPKKPRLPKQMNLPRLEPYYFYNKTRLEELHEMQKNIYDEEVKKGTDMSKYDNDELLLPKDLEEERQKLLQQGFPKFNRKIYNSFTDSLCICDKSDYESITQHISDSNITVDDVKEYSKVFWARGQFDLPDWDKIMRKIKQAEAKREEINLMRKNIKEYILKYPNPYIHLPLSNPVTTKSFTPFTQDEDKYLLCFVTRYGYGNWGKIQRAVRRCPLLCFDWYIKTLTENEIQKRCEKLMKMISKDLDSATNRAKTISDLKSKIKVIKESEKERIQQQHQQQSKDGEAKPPKTHPPIDAKEILSNFSEEIQKFVVTKVVLSMTKGLEHIVNELYEKYEKKYTKKLLSQLINILCVKTKYPDEKHTRWHMKDEYKSLYNDVIDDKIDVSKVKKQTTKKPKSLLTSTITTEKNKQKNTSDSKKESKKDKDKEKEKEKKKEVKIDSLFKSTTSSPTKLIQPVLISHIQQNNDFESDNNDDDEKIVVMKHKEKSKKHDEYNDVIKIKKQKKDNKMEEEGDDDDEVIVVNGDSKKRHRESEDNSKSVKKQKTITESFDKK